jgi:hypothetical protein
MSTDAKPCEAVLGRVCVIIRDALDWPVAQFSRATVLADQGIKHRELIHIGLSIEDEFDVDLNDAPVRSWSTIGDICDWLESVR